MDVRFSGVTRVTGPGEKVQCHLSRLISEEIKSADFPVWAYNDKSKTRAVLVTGKDSIEFMKTKCGIKIPREFEGKSLKEMRALGKGNPEILDKFSDLGRRLLYRLDALSNPPALYNRLTRYYADTKAAGKDAEGNPVKDVSL